MIEGNAARAAVKFMLCAGVAIFVGVAIVATFPAGFFKPMLYVMGGGVCIALLWPNQADGEALLKK